MIAHNGQKVEKPLFYWPIIKVERTIMPIQRVDIKDWPDVIHKELNALETNTNSGVSDCELVEINHKQNES